jgi:hypothetical protein
LLSWRIIDSTQPQSLTLAREGVINALSDQSDRTVLWVFDYDGNCSKAELSHYLTYKWKYHIFKAFVSRYVCGMITVVISK